MATKEELLSLLELGSEIQDTENREKHKQIILIIAERSGIPLGENVERKEEEEERKELPKTEDRKKIQQNKEEQQTVDENAKRLAETRRREEQVAKAARETREREAKEKEFKEQASKRASLRHSTMLTGFNTGNTIDEVQARIPKPNPRAADLTDPSISQIYVNIRDDNHPTDWMMLRYEGQTNKLKAMDSGTGGFQEFSSRIVEEPCFGYFRYTFGDTKRTKFIFVSYVPEKINGLKKAKIASHKPEVASFLKYFHVELNALSKDEITTAKLEAKLKMAGGADYGTGRGGGNNGGENFGGIKANAASFYAKTDKESKPVTYAKGPLSTTPIDLSGRPMVAAASEARKNIVNLA